MPHVPFVSFLFLTSSIFLFSSHVFAQRDPDEIKMSCNVPIAQVSKGLATLARQEAEFAGYEKVRASVKLKKLESAEKDVFYAEDYLRKVGLKGDGLNLKVTPKLNVRLAPCSQFFQVTIKISAQSSDGKRVTGSASTENVEISGYFQ